MKKITILSILGIALLAPLAPRPADAQVSKSGNGYLLRQKHVKGTVAKYRITTKMAAMPKGMTMDITMKTTKVVGKVGTIESVTNMTANGTKQKPTTTIMDIDDRGRIVGGDKNPMMTPVALPVNPVAVGGTWSGDMSGQGGMTARSTYKFNGIKTIGGQSVADISVTMKGSMMGSKVAGAGKMYVRVADGSLQSTNINMNISIPTQKGQKPQPPMAMAMVMQRL